MNNTSKTRLLVEGALMVSLTTILSMIQIPGPWINGGSITAFSMLPVALFAFRHDLKWGLFTAFTAGFMQIIVGVNSFKGISLITLIGSIFLDYLFAYGALGFAGVFKHKIKKANIAFASGCLISGIIRFFCHFISGFLLWSDIISEGMAAIIFSFGYNIGYMLPEISITVLGALFFGNLLLKENTI